MFPGPAYDCVCQQFYGWEQGSRDPNSPVDLLVTDMFLEKGKQLSLFTYPLWAQVSVNSSKSNVT